MWGTPPSHTKKQALAQSPSPSTETGAKIRLITLAIAIASLTSPPGLFTRIETTVYKGLLSFGARDNALLSLIASPLLIAPRIAINLSPAGLLSTSISAALQIAVFAITAMANMNLAKRNVFIVDLHLHLRG
jgi:hypothetical protein